MATELSIINEAAAALGEELLSSLGGEKPSRLERVTRALLPSVRDKMLRLHPWLCAERRLELTRHPMSARADWSFSHLFLLPEGVLRVWSVKGADRWQVGTWDEADGDGVVLAERPCIFADAAGPLRARVVRRVGWGALDPLLATAMAEELAARAAGPMQADKALAKSLKQDAREALALAVTAETSEFVEDPPEGEGRWLGSR